jgi:hypothetical protein
MVAALVLTGCFRSSQATPTPTQHSPLQPTPTVESAVRVGQPFDVRVGQTATIAGRAVTVTFTGVENDSRCPIDVVCVRAGDATVLLSVRAASSAPVRLTLVIGAEDTPKDTAQAGDLAFTALVLSPAPVSTQKIEERDYILRLVAREA